MLILFFVGDKGVNGSVFYFIYNYFSGLYDEMEGQDVLGGWKVQDRGGGS